MKFRQFVPEYNASERESIGTSHCETSEVAEEIALFLQAVAEENFIRNKRPFYRLYPGITEALTKIGVEKHDISKIHPPVNPLSLEFPIDRPLIAGTRKIVNILFGEFENTDSLFIEYRSHVDTFGVILFPREKETIMHLIGDTKEESDRETNKVVLQIVFGVCMIPHTETDLIKPLVLNRDKEKFAATGDVKFIDRAKRNGVHGWEIGRDIPTQEEMEILRQQHGEPGRKSPHWRMGHFAIRHTGEGRSIPVIRWIKETFINKDLWKEVPTGYHGAAEEYGKETENAPSDTSSQE
jgi:hypothetical protein